MLTLFCPQLGSKLMQHSWGHTQGCQCGLCPAVSRLLRVVATGSQLPGFVGYATLRVRNVLGELQDYIEANPPVAREGAARPPPPQPVRPGGRPVGEPLRDTRPGDDRVNSSRASPRREEGERNEIDRGIENRNEASRGRSAERDRDRGGRREEVEARDRPLHPRREVPPAEARRSLSAKSKSAAPRDPREPSEEPETRVKREEEATEVEDTTPGVREVASASPHPEEAEEVRSEEEKKKKRRRRRRRESKSEEKRFGRTTPC